MRVLFVVQRYGTDVAGGAETHCREFATRLAGRGHEVEVVTSCARRYSDWANEYPSGVDGIDGVTVHRLPVAAPRDAERFAHVNARVMSPGHVSLGLQREWMRLQGPWVPELEPWLLERAASYDVVVFFTYLYFTTWCGLWALAGAGDPVPTLLHPTAHEEPPIHLRLFDGLFRRPRAFNFSSPEEEELVRERFGIGQPSRVIGVGTELEPGGDPGSFRERFGLGDRRYLLYVGRYDVGKASGELLAAFRAFKDRRPDDLALVILGDPVDEPPSHADVVVTGFVDEATKHDALSGALALAQPSHRESFSMVLVEAWAHRKPVVVQGATPVLAGQVRRSGGGIPYRGFHEFEAAVEILLAEPELGRRLGEAGRAYVERHYPWTAVLDDYEAHLEAVVARA